MYMKIHAAVIPEIQIPYKVILGTSSQEINKIASTLTCNEQRNFIKDCATECVNRSLSSSGCPGFYTDRTQNNMCYICHVSYVTEIQANDYTSFSSNNKLYILQSKSVTPDVSMDFDNYAGNTFYGKNLLGTAINVNPSDYVSGIHNEGLHLHDGGNVRLTGSGTKCWTNLAHCVSGMTVCFWYKATTVVYNYIAASGFLPLQPYGLIQ